jgi:hypothetical protein
MKRSWDLEAAAEYFSILEEQVVEGFSDAAMVFQVHDFQSKLFVLGHWTYLVDHMCY